MKYFCCVAESKWFSEIFFFKQLPVSFRSVLLNMHFQSLTVFNVFNPRNYFYDLLTYDYDFQDPKDTDKV